MHALSTILFVVAAFGAIGSNAQTTAPAPAAKAVAAGTVKAVQPGLFEVAGPRVDEVVAAGIQKITATPGKGGRSIVVQSPWGYSYFGWPKNMKPYRLRSRPASPSAARRSARPASTTLPRPTTRRRSRSSFRTRLRPRYRTRPSHWVPAADANRTDYDRLRGVATSAVGRSATVDDRAARVQTRFNEVELCETTEIFGNVAHRFNSYAKSGTMKGVVFAARGMISTQFVNTAAGWRISAMAWDDERPGVFNPGALRTWTPPASCDSRFGVRASESSDGEAAMLHRGLSIGS